MQLAAWRRMVPNNTGEEDPKWHEMRFFLNGQLHVVTPPYLSGMEKNLAYCIWV